MKKNTLYIMLYVNYKVERLFCNQIMEYDECHSVLCSRQQELLYGTCSKLVEDNSSVNYVWIGKRGE